MTTVTALIDSWGAQRPDATFLIAPEAGTELSFGELRRLAGEVQRRLSAMGIAKGEKVALMMDNGRWTATLFLAVMYSGRVVVPLNAVSGDAQLQYVLDHSDSRTLFVSGAHRERMERILRAIPRPVVPVAADEDGGPDWPPGEAGPDERVEIAADDEALLIYTSGTTGVPKGAVLTHRNVVAGGHNTVEAHALSPEDRALCVLPLYHINGEIVTAIAPLVSGGSIVMPHRFSVSSFWELIAQYRCTWFSVVPTIISYLLDKADTTARSVKGQAGFAQVRFGRSASSALAPATHRGFEEAFGIPIVETMGLTETAAQILSNPLPPLPSKYGSPGIPYGNEVVILTADGRRGEPGEVGELLVRGDNVMKEYYKNPEATRKALEPDGWLHTGDLGYRDEDGFFFITGRLKELIIKGGENVAPREVDDVLYQHPAVREAATFGVDDDRYGQEIMACVVLKEDVRCDGEQIRAFCTEKLGKFKTPKQVMVVEWLPKGPSGKIQRLKIADMLPQLSSAPEPEQGATN